MKGFVLGLSLKRRLRATWKRAIVDSLSKEIERKEKTWQGIFQFVFLTACQGVKFDEL